MHDIPEVKAIMADIVDGAIRRDREAVESFLREMGADPGRHELVIFPPPDIVQGRLNDRVIALVPKEAVPTDENGLLLTREEARALYPSRRIYTQVKGPVLADM